MLFGRDNRELKEEVCLLNKERKNLERTVEKLKMQKRLEQEEIQHMVKINNEKKDQEVERKKLDLEIEKEKEIVAFKKKMSDDLVDLHRELHEKMEKRFNSELGNLKEIYNALMKRLPNVNLQLEKKLD